MTNSPPVFDDDSLTVTVNENATTGTVGTVTATDPDGDTITYSVGGADEMAFNEDFSLDTSNGEITVNSDATIDHESKPSYSVAITAADPYGGADTVALTINVTDVDEPGTVTLSRASPAVDIPLTAALTDPDGGVTGATWTWSWSTTSSGSFTTISGASTASYTPVSGDLGRYLKAAVSYTDSFGSGKSAERVSDNAVVANPPPVFADDSLTFTVTENVTSGTVGTVTADDPDGETITYSVAGTEETAFNEDFSLNASTGEITVKSDATIDHESKPSYRVTVDATDPSGSEASATLTINVTDADDPGFVYWARATPLVDRRTGVRVRDDDRLAPGGGPSYTYSWSTTPTGPFTTYTHLHPSIAHASNVNTFAPVAGDVGRYLKATVSYTDSFGEESIEVVSDNPVAADAPQASITGILEVGLMAMPSFTQGGSIDYYGYARPDRYAHWAYQWISVDSDSETVVYSTTDQYEPFYRIQEADVGKRLKLRTLMRENGDPTSERMYTSKASDIVRGASSYLGSNLGETRISSIGSTRGWAHGFTTGINPAELTAVRMQWYNVDEPGRPIPSSEFEGVYIYSDASGLPGTRLHVFTPPAHLQKARKSGWTADEFTASDVTLSANTRYWVVVEGQSWGYTHSTDQATGWSLDDVSYYKNSLGIWTRHDWGVFRPPGVEGAILKVGFLGRTIPTAPSFATKPLTFIVNENAASGAVVGTAGATDADGDPLMFTVSGADAAAFGQVFALSAASGEITVKEGATVDHESKDSYAVTISVTDGEDAAGVMEGAATVDDTVALTITVTDIDEQGMVALSQATPAVNRPLAATLTDPDGPVTGASWTWSWSTTSTGSFTTISGANSATYTPASGDVGRFLKASVSYTDSFDSGKSADITSTNAVVANPPPVFADDSVTFTVNENATTGTVGTVTATDPDGETITYSVGGADEMAFNEDFSLNTSTGETTVKSDATIDHESKPSYSVTITATDPSGGTDTIGVIINVTDVDEPGMVALSRATPALGIPLTAALTDPDGVTSPTWSWWSASNRAGSFSTILGANSATYTPASGDVGRFLRATASYTDAFSLGKSVSRTADNATVANPPPVFADDSVTFTVNENATTGTVGTVTATDPGNEVLAYSVGGTDETAFNEDFSLNTSTGEITVKSDATIDFETKNSYSITVTATDPFRGVDTINITIRVQNVNEPGTVTFSGPAVVARTLTPSLSDPDGAFTNSSWIWSKAPFINAGFTTIPGATNKSYTPVQADYSHYLKVTWTYEDRYGPGQTAEAITEDTVVNNPPPVFADDSYTFTVNENATAGTVGTVTATDPDGETITYSVGDDDVAFNEDFSLNASTGEITVKSDATIDFESKASYLVTIRATDTALKRSTVDVTINVTDVDDLGTVTLSRATPALGIPLTASLSDSDGVTGATWTWARASTRTGGFSTIPEANIATYTPVQADVARFLRATVNYTDSFGSGKSAQQVSDNAVLANPPPVFRNPSVTFTVNENAITGTVGTVTATDPDGETITYSVGGTDETAFNDDFALDASSGEITVKSDATIDHESKASYSVRITATDPSTGTSAITVTINVIDVDEQGTVALSQATPAVNRPLTATLTDPDGGVTGATWIWAWSTTRTGSFTTISGASAPTYTPASGDLGRFLKASVSYTDSFDSGKSADITSTNAVVANPPPVFADDSVAFTVDENATTGTVGTVTATDPDGETITYSVGGTDEMAFNEDFSLNTSTGETTVKSDATIDHESKPSYSVTITATDPSGGTDTIGVIINVTDVDEPGMVALSRATPALGIPLTAALTDPDGVTSPTWSWWSASNRAGSFSTILGANSSTYTPASGDVGRFLRATATYTDAFNSGKSVSRTADNATVANPPPVFADDSVTFTVNENATTGTVGTVTATDPGNEVLAYSVGGTDETAFNEDFSLDTSSGEITVKSDATIDHESKPSYSVRITARDPSGGTDAISVTINVTDVDDPGTVTLSRNPPAVGAPLTATLTDPDGGVTAATWTWAWSTTRTGSFTTISGASTATYTPASGDLGRYLKAAVSYTDSFGSGKTAAMTSINAVVANPPPVFASASYTFTVHENATSGRVGRVRATDPDGETITYSVGGVDVAAFNEDFSLNSSTGVIRVKSDATITQEIKPSYSVTITATDPFGGTDTVAVTINVIDAALAPPINLQASATDDRVTLTWKGNISNFHVSGYRIERYGGHSSGWQTLEPLWPAANTLPWDNPGIRETYVDTDVLPSAPYRYRIWSVNDRGIRSLYAAGVDVETAVDPPELRIFADHGRVTIGWDAPEDDSVTGYRILRRVQWGDEETLVDDTGRGVTAWVDRRVSPGTAYAYRLQALHDGQPGTRSRYLFALTPQTATPTVVVSEPDGQDLAAGTETIGRIDVGGSVTGTIDSVDDRDWFAVEMEAGETYHARLSYMTEDGLRSFANGRVVLGCLMDADGTDSPDTCLNKGRVEFEVQQAGRYYIVVQPRWYRADLGHPEMPTEYELELDHDVDLPQDSSIAAPYGALRTSSEVEVGTWVSGDLHNGDRADNHRVQLREGHWYRVPVFFDYGPEADGVVANAGAVRIGTGDGNSRWSETSPHLFRASQTGTHYLNVAREADISTIYATRNTYYFREATYKFLVEDLGTLEVGEATTTQGQRANSPATGGPGIIGNVWAGETLTATTDLIEDEDGLTGAVFSYQWVRSDTDIEGAASSNYTVTGDDEGKPIQVRVTFTDDAGNVESLTSYAKLSAPPLIIPDEEPPPKSSETREAREAQEAAESPLTAAIHDAPESHDGQAALKFELRFSEDPKEDFSYKTLRDHAFTVTRGTVAGARRLDGDSDTPNIRWEISVTPDSTADVTVELPVTTDCEAQGAICADDGTMLSSPLKFTVKGPPLTASFESVPTSHNGSGEFRFRIAFSEEFSLSYKTLRDDHVFTVEGGKVTGARRLVKGSNIGWEIVVKPDSNGDVTITLPVTTDCDAQGAVCTNGDKKLSNRLELTVSGPGQ